MKKIRNIIAILTFAICMMLVGKDSAYAASLADLKANAKELKYGQAVAGSVSGKNDADYYKFKVE